MRGTFLEGMGGREKIKNSGVFLNARTEIIWRIFPLNLVFVWNYVGKISLRVDSSSLNGYGTNLPFLYPYFYALMFIRSFFCRCRLLNVSQSMKHRKT